jgi:hypothetical protein
MVETPYPLRLAATKGHSQLRHAVGRMSARVKRSRSGRGEMLPPVRRGLNGDSWSLKNREPRSGAIRANRTETGKKRLFHNGGVFGINTPARGALLGGSVANTVYLGRANLTRGIFWERDVEAGCDQDGYSALSRASRSSETSPSTPTRRNPGSVHPACAAPISLATGKVALPCAISRP